MERPIDRIQSVVDYLKKCHIVHSQASFEKIVGLSPHYIKNMLATEKGNPSVIVVAQIYEVFSTINLEWIITGKGHMFKYKKKEDIMRGLAEDFVRYASVKKLIENL